jgi:hypothetical protein
MSMKIIFATSRLRLLAAIIFTAIIGVLRPLDGLKLREFFVVLNFLASPLGTHLAFFSEIPERSSSP